MKRIAVFGLGRIGRMVVERVLADDQFTLVAVWDRDPDLAGGLVSAFIGASVPNDLRVTDFDRFPWHAEPVDVVIYSGSDNLVEAESHLATSVRNGAHVVGFTVALSYPWARHPDIAERLDLAAKQAGVTILGTGVNPGFVSDLLLLGLASSSTNVETVSLARTNDLSDQSAEQLDARAIGVTVIEFMQQLEDGRVKVHTGFEESAALLSRGLGWELSHTVREVEPVVAPTSIHVRERDIAVGCVSGIRAVGLGYIHDRLRVRIEHTHVVAPDAHGLLAEDHIQIQGTPPIDLRIRPEIQGAGATAAMAINAISAFSTAPRGLVLVGL